MAEIIGKIIDIKNKTYTVEIDRFNACGSCNSRGHCRLVDKNEKIILNIKYDRQLNIGDKVVLQTKDSHIILLSVLFYLFPVLMISIGILFSHRFVNNQVLSGIIGLLAGVFSFIIIYIVDKKLGKKIKHQIKRVIK